MQYERFFDPLGAGPEHAPCPQVFFASSDSQFVALLDRHRESWACTIVIVYSGSSTSAAMREAIDAMMDATGALNVVCNSEKDLSAASVFEIPRSTHIAIFGENIANREAPFGAFSVVAPVYAIGGTRRSLSAYTSTFAGNATALGVALRPLE